MKNSRLNSRRSLPLSITLAAGFLVACGQTTFAPEAYARGHIDGNGGDHVRATFMKTAQAVTDYLRDTAAGAQLLKDKGLDIDRLQALISIDVISVDSGVLIDNGGSRVDAIGEVGKIFLSKNAWAEHFEKSRDVYYLVFHEMLRALPVQDDNYVISKALNPFPESRRIVTRIESAFPLLGDDNLAGILLTDQLAVNGSGCPLGRLGTSAEVDLERNVLDLSFRNYQVQVGATGEARLARKACALAMPIHVPAGKRLVISQLDMYSKLDFVGSVSAKMGLEAFLAGGHGPMQNKEFFSDGNPVQGRLLLRRNDVLKTGCGGHDILRLNTSALAQAQSSGDSSRSNIFEIDRMSVSFKIESCTNSRN